jgi:hypothetical protein
MFRLIVLSIASIFASGTAAATPTESAFTFQFQPPDGVRVNLTSVLQRSRSTEGSTSLKEEAESRTSGVFKRTAQGFEYAPKIVSATMRRNGNLIGDPLTSLLAKLQPKFTLSSDGEALAITGFGEVSEQLKASVPPQAAAALAPIINEEALVGQQRAEWNARYADFAGGKFEIGQVLDVQAPQLLPNGETITYTIRTSFTRWETCPAGMCVRIDQIYESDGSALAQMMTNVVNGVMAAASSPIAPISVAGQSAARISGSLTRLIDPKTMLIYSERLQRTISMQIESQGRTPEAVRLDETRTYSYSYE